MILFPWLKDPSISLITGWRGVGKTWFALSLLDGITSGTPVGPWECRTAVTSLFLDGEMPAQDIRERIDQLPPSEHKAPLFVYSDAYANTLGLPRAHLANESWRTRMKSILLTRGVKLWIVDNLASLASGLDENSKKDWDPINSWLLELRFAGISTIMLHHVNKEGGQRGTSAREDNLDISIMLKPPRDYTPDDGARFICHFSKARVSTSDLQLIGDMEFKLTEDDRGKYVWTWGSVRAETRREVLRLIDEGLDPKAICEALGITKGTVSKIRRKGVEDGFLTPKGSLTQTGYLLVNEA